jgi:small-conductance mechanosensitive channel/CRP-like cAMP-binding protein
MFELSQAAKNLVLIFSVPGLFMLMVVFGRWLKRTHGVRLNWTFHLFSLTLSVYFVAKLFDDPLILPMFGGAIPLRRETGAVACLLGAFFIIALLDRYLWELYFQEKHRVKVPKFLSDVVTLSVITIAIIVVLELGYKVKIAGLVLGPSAIAVIVGLAMQDLFGNIISGMALQFGKSFKDGDWLFINNSYAKVIDINWRTTRMVTIDDISIDVPNRDLAKQTIINLNLPTRTHAMRISVSLDYSAPPTRVKDILLHATSNAKGVLHSPPPAVYLKNFGDYAVEYEIKFYSEHHEQHYEVCDAIRTNVWYSLQRNGIRIPFPIRTVQVERPQRTKQQEIQSTARIMLRQNALFKDLTDIQLDALLPRGQVVQFGKGEKLIEQGHEGQSMFILVTGEANVVVQRAGTLSHVASLRAGDCFGEMSLLTGEPRTATVMAHTDCEVVEIAKPVLAHSLRENPELLAKLSSLLAERQMKTEGIVAANMKPHEVETAHLQFQNSFKDKLVRFFEL